MSDRNIFDFKSLKGDWASAAIAGHLIEDSYAGGHRYQAYSNGIFPSAAHKAADAEGAPGYSDAQAAATRYFSDLRTGNMKNPESYLFQPTNCN